MQDIDTEEEFPSIILDMDGYNVYYDGDDVINIERAQCLTEDETWPPFFTKPGLEHYLHGRKRNWTGVEGK